MQKLSEHAFQALEQWAEHYFADAWHIAQQRAKALRRPIVASVTFPIENIDPVQVFVRTRLHREASLFWELPDGRMTVGIGEVAAFKSSGNTRFTLAIAYKQELLRDAVVQTYDGKDDDARPLLFGGFAFNEQYSTSRLWNFLPNSLLFLPRLIISGYRDRWMLTINTRVKPTDQWERCAKQLFAGIHSLLHNHTEPSTASSGASLAMTFTDASAQSAEKWMRAFTRAVEMIRQGIYQQLHLAHITSVAKMTSENAWPFEHILRRLRHHHPEQALFAIQYGSRLFCGTALERIAAVQHGHVHTTAMTPLAPFEHQSRDTLLKIQRSIAVHDIVSQALREKLGPLCFGVLTGAPPGLRERQQAEYLATSIAGELLPGQTILDVVAALHPAAINGGQPDRGLFAALRRYEHFERGWFAGPVGWIDAAGNGEFSAALSGVLFERSQATFFLGSDVVSDGDIQSIYNSALQKLRLLWMSVNGEL